MQSKKSVKKHRRVRKYTIMKDKEGKYIMIGKKKYRIGDKVEKETLVDFIKRKTVRNYPETLRVSRPSRASDYTSNAFQGYEPYPYQPRPKIPRRRKIPENEQTVFYEPKQQQYMQSYPYSQVTVKKPKKPKDVIYNPSFPSYQNPKDVLDQIKNMYNHPDFQKLIAKEKEKTIEELNERKKILKFLSEYSDDIKKIENDSLSSLRITYNEIKDIERQDFIKLKKKEKDDKDRRRYIKYLTEEAGFSNKEVENETTEELRTAYDNIINVEREEAKEDDIHPTFHEGNGKFQTDKGLTNFQINEIMGKYPEFLGTISHNEIESEILPKVKEKSRGGFIINTDPKSGAGEHWQALFFDSRPNSRHEIDYFDSFGRQADKTMLRGVKKICDKLKSGTYLKFKENRIVLQNDKSSNCGYFCCEFLIDRFRGLPFKDASGFNDQKWGENDIEKFKHKFKYIASFDDQGKTGGSHISDILQSYYDRRGNRLFGFPHLVRKSYFVHVLVEDFGYKIEDIEHLSIERLEEIYRNELRHDADEEDRLETRGEIKGGDLITNASNVISTVINTKYRDNYPPNVRKYLESPQGDEVITNIFVCRKPIEGALKKVLNVLSLGALDKAQKHLGYADLFHLFFIINHRYRLERNHVVTMFPEGLPSGVEKIQLPLNGKVIKIKDFLENTSKKVGPSLQRYDPSENNCQVYILQNLSANGLGNPEVERFVKQDVKTIISSLPYFTQKLSKLTTDLAHKLDVIFRGRGITK